MLNIGKYHVVDAYLSFQMICELSSNYPLHNRPPNDDYFKREVILSEKIGRKKKLRNERGIGIDFVYQHCLYFISKSFKKNNRKIILKINISNSSCVYVRKR